MKKGKIGVVFPMLPQHAHHVFDEGKDIFVKFSKLKKLIEGSKIVFYVSKKKVFVGEGVIGNVQKLEPKEAWTRYGNRIFLTKEEYDNYVTRSPLGKRKPKPIMVYLLRELRRYKKPIPSRRRMTVAGYYITRKDYESIVR